VPPTEEEREGEGGAEREVERRRGKKGKKCGQCCERRKK